MTQSNLYFRSFMILLIVVSIAFIWVLLPYYGAIFWGVILAVIFQPLHRRVLRSIPGRRNLAALITLLFVILLVVLPTILITTSLLQEVVAIFKKVESGEINFARYLEQVTSALPPWAHEWLARLGMDNPFGLREKLAQGALQGSKYLASQAVNIGQNTFEFLVGMAIMLYLLFFLLRDGVGLARHSKTLIPLSEEHQHHLFRKFTTVVRATVKGNIAVAITQGSLGGLIFWFLGIQGALLWGVVMTFLSLLPAVGAAIIWLPVAVYFLVTGSTWEGIILILFGVLVIGLVDNILRPLLVGKDTKIPDYVILISTLGGLSVFGLNGFVIGPLFAAMFIACWDLFPSALRMNQARNAWLRGGGVPPGGLGGPAPGGPMPGGPMPGGPMPGGPMPGEPIPGGPISGGPAHGGPIPGGAMPGGPMPGALADAPQTLPRMGPGPDSPHDPRLGPPPRK